MHARARTRRRDLRGRLHELLVVELLELVLRRARPRPAGGTLHAPKGCNILLNFANLADLGLIVG